MVRLSFILFVFSLFVPAAVLESHHSKQDLALTANPGAPHWRTVQPLVIESDFSGKPLPGHRTEVRSRWTDKHLYLLFVNRYQTLNLKPNPVTDSETQQLWNWDVSEAFIGSNFQNIRRYKEFQVSPQGEWVDLDIDRVKPLEQPSAWNSGFTVKARIDREKKIWYGEMKIPFSAIDSRSPVPGNELRLGLFRIEGEAPNRIHVSWQTTGGKTFHTPERFQVLRLLQSN